MSIKNLIAIFFIVFSFVISFGGESVFAASGKCGSAQYQSFSTVPTNGFCSSGTPSNISVHSNYNQTMCIGSGPWPADPYSGYWQWWCNDTYCRANDPNFTVKQMFGASEVVSYTGSPSDPETVEFWAEAYCPNAGTERDYVIPSNYKLVSCSNNADALGTHGGCRCCVMSRIKVTKSSACTSFTYSAWSACQPNNTQTRTVIASYPSGCTDGNSITTQSCTYGPVNGTCGGANGHVFLSTDSGYTSIYNQCATGTPTYTYFPRPGTFALWECNGVNGGTDSATCLASGNRKPIVTNGTLTYSVAASSSINFTGFSASDPDRNSLAYAWACTNGGRFTNNAIANPQYIAPATARTDTCILIVSDGYEATFAYAIVTVNNTPVNGVCGGANGHVFLSTDSAYTSTYNQCATGTPTNTNFPAQGGMTTWTCGGSNGGSSSGTCTATRDIAPMTTTALNFKSPLDIATAIGSTDESCWYCSHYRNTSNAITSALGGAAGNLQFKFDYQSSAGNMTGYQFAIGPTNDVSAATTIKSSDWVSASGASGTTVTVDSINGLPVSVKISPSQAMSQLAYGTTYYWWVKVKNATEESDWVSAGTYATSSHHYPDVKVVYTGSGINNFQACTTVKSLTGTHNDDPCFSTCWKGSGNAIDLNSSNWVCSTCYNSSTNLPQLCGTNTITWTLPSNKPTGFNFRTGSTSTTNNPIFTSLASGQTVNLQVDIAGSSCPLEQGLSGSTTPMPKWYEVSPF